MVKYIARVSLSSSLSAELGRAVQGGQTPQLEYHVVLLPHNISFFSPRLSFTFFLFLALNLLSSLPTLLKMKTELGYRYVFSHVQPFHYNLHLYSSSALFHRHNFFFSVDKSCQESCPTRTHTTRLISGLSFAFFLFLTFILLSVPSPPAVSIEEKKSKHLTRHLIRLVFRFLPLPHSYPSLSSLSTTISSLNMAQ